MSKPRRRHTAEQKAELLRQHVAEKKPVSEVCNEAEIQPSLFYTWQRELLAGAHTVFSTRRDAASSGERPQIFWCYPVSAENPETQVGICVLAHTWGFSEFSERIEWPSKRSVALSLP